MHISFELIIVAALIGAGLSFYLAFLPVASVPRKVFIQGTSIMSIAWMAVCFVFGFKQPMLLLIAAASSISCWKFVKQDTTKAKLLMAFASGVGVSLGVFVLLQSYFDAVNIPLSSPQFIGYAANCYVGALLIATAVTALLLYHNQTPEQSTSHQLSLALIHNAVVAILGDLVFTITFLVINQRQFTGFWPLLATISWSASCGFAMIAWNLNRKTADTKMVPPFLYALTVVSILATVSSVFVK